MARTPEGKVKDRLKKEVLDPYEVNYFMPVQGGYGAPALDYICCYKGKYFQIETKTGSKEMTPRQKTIAMQVARAGGMAFLINDDGWTWRTLVKWMNEQPDIE